MFVNSGQLIAGVKQVRGADLNVTSSDGGFARCALRSMKAVKTTAGKIPAHDCRTASVWVMVGSGKFRVSMGIPALGERYVFLVVLLLLLRKLVEMRTSC